MTIGAGIAIAGIWIGVGIIGINGRGEYVGFCAACAAFATMVVSIAN
jgi:hypothetical protein